MKIGELAARTGLAPSAIRYYEQSGLLPEPQRGPNGYRVYPETAVERLHLIRTSQQLGFSLDTLRGAFARCETLSPDDLLGGVDGRLDEIVESMATLRAQRTELRRLRTLLLEARRAGSCAGLMKDTRAPASSPVPARKPRVPTAPLRARTARNGLAPR
ncbi:MerR family transcriptional regulator [Paraburkholderia sp.]|uniref:MerR family transcriptional regulator n=1 Tax=Paraburkholderia sp. TaxID=1926495 RepID=UPI003D6EEF5C